jgi:hypothetical protein
MKHLREERLRLLKHQNSTDFPSTLGYLLSFLFPFLFDTSRRDAQTPGSELFYNVLAAYKVDCDVEESSTS